MDIYTYAMQLEEDGERYYRETAERIKNAGVRNILTMLADAEVRHYHIFEQMKNRETARPADLGYLANVKNIFARMIEEKEQIEVNGSQTDLYRKAQALEEKTRDFYREKSAEVDETQRAIFLKISTEEQKHYDILENIVLMVSRPQYWLEDAEWFRFEEY